MTEFDLPQINVPLIRKVLAHIKDQPKRLEMGTWHLHVGRREAKALRSPYPDCGTRACFAGWLYIKSAKSKAESDRRLKETSPSLSTIRQQAQLAVGFTWDEAEDVFSGDAVAETGFKRQFAALRRELNAVFVRRGLKARV